MSTEMPRDMKEFVKEFCELLFLLLTGAAFLFVIVLGVGYAIEKMFPGAFEPKMSNYSVKAFHADIEKTVDAAVEKSMNRNTKEPAK